MALNDSKKFAQYDEDCGKALHNNSTDVFKWVWITEVFSAIDANAVDPVLVDFTQVASAGNYVANETIASTTWVRTGADTVIDGTDATYAADGANPVTAKTLLIYNDTSASKDVVMVIDATVDDGTTPADTTLGFTAQWNAAGIARVRTNA